MRRGTLLILTNIVNAMAMSRFSLSQSFNLIGIKSFLTSLSQPELFIPNGIYDHVTKIPLLELKKLGIKGLIFDKDNTLTEPYKVSLNSDIEKFLRRANKVW
jgi:phosphatidylglycerophosphatase GEP4